MTKTLIGVSKELYNRIKEQAYSLGLSISGFLELVLRDYFFDFDGENRLVMIVRRGEKRTHVIDIIPYSQYNYYKKKIDDLLLELKRKEKQIESLKREIRSLRKQLRKLDIENAFLKKIIQNPSRGGR